MTNGEKSMNCVYRINLKTGGSEKNKVRDKLIDFCLHNPQKQFLAIGWYYVYEKDFLSEQASYSDYYYAVKKYEKRINPVHNIFWNTKEGTLFWTRDLSGFYWICRAKGAAETYLSKELDIGAVIPVEAYCYGLEVPGQIKASFNRPRAGTAEIIRDPNILEFSKYVFNQCANRTEYVLESTLHNNIIENLPDLELEELIIAYLQIELGYYVLSNSIANKSTTIKVECELMSRDVSNPQKAVVQVKAGNQINLCASEYKEFADNGYNVYLYCPHFIEDYKSDKIVHITKDTIMKFYNKHKLILPDSITKWESLFTI